MSLRSERAAQVGDRLLRLDRPAIVVIEGAAGRPSSAVRRSWWTSVSRASCRSLASRPPMPCGQDGGKQPAERAVDVADELDLGLVVGVDLGRLGVDVDDPLAPVRVPARRRVLDQVVADRHDEVGAIEARQHVIAGLEPDRHQRQVAAVVDRALAHERHRDRDVEPLGERAQGRAPRSAGARRCRPGRAAASSRRGAARRGRSPRRSARGSRPVSARGAEVVGRRVVGREVLGQLDVGRAGLLELGDAERLAHDLGHGAGRSTRWFHFVTGSNMRTMSTNWWASLWSLSSPVWPVIATIGAWSR